MSYTTAVGFARDGRMLCGTVQEGLLCFSKALDTDPLLDAAAYARGIKEWRDRGLHLTSGQHGFPFDGAPPPWGVSDDLDYLLTAHGHMRD